MGFKRGGEKIGVNNDTWLNDTLFCAGKDKKIVKGNR